MDGRHRQQQEQRCCRHAWVQSLGIPAVISVALQVQQRTQLQRKGRPAHYQTQNTHQKQVDRDRKGERLRRPPSILLNTPYCTKSRRPIVFGVVSPLVCFSSLSPSL